MYFGWEVSPRGKDAEGDFPGNGRNRRGDDLGACDKLEPVALEHRRSRSYRGAYCKGCDWMIIRIAGGTFGTADKGYIIRFALCKMHRLVSESILLEVLQCFSLSR